MNYNKYQQISNITFLVVLIIVGIILVLVGLIIKEPDHQVIMAQETIQGYRISSSFPLDGIENVTGSIIEWEETIPDEEKTRIFIKTIITAEGEPPPDFDSEWQPVASGNSIPGIGPGAVLDDKYLWTMQILETDDPTLTPQLHSLTETITMAAEGYRISPEFNISGDDIVKKSQIFWQADERFNETIEVKVSYDGGNTWSDEKIVNGASIPGLEPGTSLSGVKMKTKTSFLGGPDYPSLENIKIFIELE